MICSSSFVPSVSGREALRFAALEERRAVGTRQQADLDRDRADVGQAAAVEPLPCREDHLPHRLVLDVVQHRQRSPSPAPGYFAARAACVFLVDRRGLLRPLLLQQRGVRRARCSLSRAARLARRASSWSSARAAGRGPLRTAAFLRTSSICSAHIFLMYSCAKASASSMSCFGDLARPPLPPSRWSRPCPPR